MNDSCNPQSGVRFVAGLLSADEESAFVEHLNGCTACQTALESASGNPREWRIARELLAFSCADRRHATAAFDDDETLDTEMLPGVDRTSLAFLAPSDDPDMIGRIGPYEIQGVLGRGGFGIVLKGHDRALDRNVAIKVLDPSAASLAAARDRFVREAKAMAAISHVHVVPVYAVDMHGGLPYFVMEYVAGGSLERRLAREGSFDVVSIVRIGLQMAQALAAAHQQGLVHRDIKPGNVLLDRGVERVRVADFGLARVANDVSSTRSGFLAGTPQYMAPEQVRGETCDAQSDLFSLGAVMYALCTGHAPFRAETVYGVMQRIVHDEARPIREQNPLVPAWLERFVARLMEKDRARRFESAEDVGRILQNELAHLQNPALAPEPARSWMPRQPSVRMRRRRVWIGIGVAALLIAVAVTVSWWPAPHFPMAASLLPPGPQFPPPETTVASEAARVPLWNSDGTRDASEHLGQLEIDWHSAHNAPGVDSLQEQLAEIGAGLDALDADIQNDIVPAPSLNPINPVNPADPVNDGPNTENFSRPFGEKR